MFKGADPFLTWGTGVTIKHKNKLYKSVEKGFLLYFFYLVYRWHSTEKFLTNEFENPKMIEYNDSYGTNNVLKRIINIIDASSVYFAIQYFKFCYKL